MKIDDFTEQEREFLRKKIEADKEREQQELLAKRRQWADQIQALTKEKNEKLPGLKADMEKQIQKAEKQRQVFEQAQAQAGQARADYKRFLHRMESQTGNLEGELMATAAPEISEAIQFFQDQHDKIRDPGHYRRIATEGKFNLFRLRRDPGEKESNYKAINEALSYCRAAIQELQKMKLQAEPDIEWIESLKNGIPDFKDTFTPYQDPRPFADLPEGTKFLPARPESQTERLLNQCAKQFNI